MTDATRRLPKCDLDHDRRNSPRLRRHPTDGYRSVSADTLNLSWRGEMPEPTARFERKWKTGMSYTSTILRTGEGDYHYFIGFDKLREDANP